LKHLYKYESFILNMFFTLESKNEKLKKDILNVIKNPSIETMGPECEAFKYLTLIKMKKENSGIGIIIKFYILFII